MYNQFLRAAVQRLDTAVHSGVMVNNKICNNCQLRNNRGETFYTNILCVMLSATAMLFIHILFPVLVCCVVMYYGDHLQVPAAAVPSNSSLTTYVTRDAADYEDSDNVAD